MSEYIERYWRDATPQDAIKEPPMVARFRDEHYNSWVIDKLIYWDRSEVPWHRDDGYCYERCQVYDAPEPGEGWRLIDVDKEQPQEGDEVFNKVVNWWIVRPRIAPFEKNFIYRRRIEQPKSAPQYVPFTWEDREQLRGRWIAQVGDENAEQFITKFDFSYGEFYVNNKCARQLLNGWCFLDTRKPVGRRVE